MQLSGHFFITCDMILSSVSVPRVPERILAFRDKGSAEPEYLVKYVGASSAHSAWCTKKDVASDSLVATYRRAAQLDAEAPQPKNQVRASFADSCISFRALLQSIDTLCIAGSRA